MKGLVKDFWLFFSMVFVILFRFIVKFSLFGLIEYGVEIILFLNLIILWFLLVNMLLERIIVTLVIRSDFLKVDIIFFYIKISRKEND